MAEGICGCGCGSPVRPGRKYSQGHWAKTPEGRKRRRECRLGEKASNETRNKMSDAHRGHSVSEKHIASLVVRNGTGWQKTVAHKISKTLTGRTLSPEHRANIAMSSQRGPNHKWWRGGVSEYPSNWVGIRRDIRRRDGNLCMSCGTGIICGRLRAHDVHHIDGNKGNCSPENLITLCRSCHTIANNDLGKSSPRLHSILSDLYGYTYG